MSNPQTIVDIGGNNAGLKKALNESTTLIGRFAANLASVQTVAAQSIQNTGGGFAAMATKGLGSVASLAAVAGAAAISMANNTAAAANELNKLSASSGIGAQDLAKLNYAFSVGNVSSQELGQGLKGLAVKMNEAANGNEEAMNTFKALGVEVKDTSGKMRPIQEVLLDVAEAFKRMPDGAQKSALAVKLMEESGLKLLPVLNQGADAINKFGKEAEDIGIIFTPEQLAAAKEWEQNLIRLKAAGGGLAHVVGNEIVPHMAKLSSILLENKGAGLGWFDSLTAMLSGSNNPAQRVADLTEKLALLKAKRDELAKNGSPADSGLDAKIGETERALQYFSGKAQEAANAVQIAEEASAAKRSDLEQQLATKKAEMAKYVRYIQTGEQGLIEGNAKASVDRQIADQQRLVDAVREAWQKSRGDADKAKSDAASLSNQASSVRTNAADRATQMRESGLTEEERQSANASRAEEMLGQGRYYAAAAGAAQLDGRAKDFEQYAKQAKDFLERAQKFADASGNADLVEEAGKQQANLLDAQAKGKQKEAGALDEQAAQQAQTLNDLQGKLDAMKESARSIEVKLKTDDLAASIATIETQLASLTAPRQIPVSVVNSGSGGGSFADGAGIQGFARGGQLPGRAPHDRADNMLYWGTPGEWVIQRQAVRHYGPSFIDAVNRMMIPKYADGGLLGNLSIPSLPTPAIQGAGRTGSGSTVVLDFGKLGRYETQSSVDTAEELTRIIQRAAFQFGKR